MDRRRGIPFALGAALLVAAALSGGRGAAASTTSSSLYVTDLADGTLVHVDPTGPTVGPEISVGQLPIDIAITADGETAYVVRGFSNAVAPVDLATSTASAAITVACPRSIALVPGRAKAYVTQGCGTTIVPLDLSTNTVGTPIDVGVPPYDVAVTADGETAWVTTRPPPDGLGTDTELIPVDVDTDVVGTPVSLGLDGQSGSVALSADGASAFVAMDTDGAVVPVDLATRTAGSPIGVSPHPVGLALTPDGETLYVTHYPLGPTGIGEPEPGDVTPIDVASGTAGSRIPVGHWTFGVAFSDDGTTAYVAHVGDALTADDSAIAQIDVGTGALTQIPFPGDPLALAIRPVAVADTTPPTLAPTVQGSGPDGAVLLNDPAAVATPNAGDGSGSGVASSSCETPNVSSVGARTLTCTATDVAGNTSAVEVSYVVQYRLVDLAPADGTTARTGRPLQIRVSLARANGTLVAPCTGCVVTFQAFAVGGSGQNAGPFEMRFHAPSQQFRESWKPAASGTGTTRLTVTVTYPGTAVTTSVSANITLT